MTQLILDIHPELIVDSFAGGGGASLGIEQALGRRVDVAINHDAEALRMHLVNHPETRHYPDNLYAVDPVRVTDGRPVGLLWASPDCTHFSRAKGGKPVKKHIRGLAWVVVKWAAKVKPRVIMLENVAEFQEWGPLVQGKDGAWRPCPRRKGQTFAKFCDALRALGYEVDYRELRACDYGAPTIRKRLFLIARRDGKPIVWPQPTHGDPAGDAVRKGRLKPWHTAAECIDWSIPCPSIFERKKPLADATLRRIANGVMRYVVNAQEPFIVRMGHYSNRTGDGAAFRGQPLTRPLSTVTAQGQDKGLVVPYVLTNTTGHPGAPADAPARTVTTGDHHALVAAHLSRQFGNSIGSDPGEPVGTILPGGGGKTALVAAFLAKHFTGVVGAPASAPTPTVTGRDHNALVAAQLVGCGGRAAQSRPRDASEPMGTLTAKADTVVAASTLLKLRGTCRDGQPTGDPLHTVSAGGTHFAQVYAFLIKYFGTATGQALTDPLHTATGKARFGVVTVTVDGVEYAIADIGMRMLTPRELYRAQGFPDGYVIGDEGDGRLSLTKTAQVRLCGNSVSPPVARALVAANVPELAFPGYVLRTKVRKGAGR